MNLPKSILIDTNILIHLEDHKETAAQYAELTRICAEAGIQICAHESSVEDINQDKDAARKAISLSKIQKYPLINRTPITTLNKAKKFGAINSRNDEVDTDLLVTVDFGVTDLLITEDNGIIKRANAAGLSARVMNVATAVSLLHELLDTVPVNYVHVENILCNQFDPEDPFFDSLKIDYPPKGDVKGFEEWFKGCMAKQRQCWLIRQGQAIGGLIIYKDELRADAKDQKELNDLGVPGNKVLKLCLFKIGENARGEKFGEQLLKIAMDYAYRNKYDAMYLTVFPKHKTLIDLIGLLGFEQGQSKGEELSYYKYSKVPKDYPAIENLDFHIKMWPCISRISAAVYCVPIQPEFHRRLFPDASVPYDPPPSSQLTFFEEPVPPRTPGNAIRKVYVSNAPLNSIPIGSIILFYRTKDSVITSVGVAESYQEARTLDELKSLVGRRSVYTEDELSERLASKDSAKVLNFYYAKDFEQGIPLAKLVDLKILKGAPQSIQALKDPALKNLIEKCLAQADRELFYEA